MKIKDLEHKKIAIWGTGIEGLAVLRNLMKRIPNADIAILNDASVSKTTQNILQEIKPKISIISGNQVKAELPNFEVVIKSPGISIYRKEIIDAKKKGVCFTSSTQLWFNEHKDDKIIAITGSKGKSTTTSLISHMLTYLGYDVVLAGNIGIPLIEMLDRKPDFWVLEMSSYQTSDFQGSADVAVLLNLYPEHLDWHRTVANYYRDKWNLLKQVKRGVVILDANSLDTKQMRLCKNTVNSVPTYFNHAKGFHFQKDWIYDGNQSIVKTEQLPLKGSHNFSNLCAALTVLKSLKLDFKKAIQSLSNFHTLPHRLTILGEKKGVLFVDDSISTIPQAAIAAIETFKGRQITILLGGYDRGISMNELVDYLFKHPVYAVITMPESGLRIAEMIRQDKRLAKFQLCETTGLKQAVTLAKKITPKGGVILLSPASPSYHAFKSFKERGKQFANLSGFNT